MRGCQFAPVLPQFLVKVLYSDVFHKDSNLVFSIHFLITSEMITESELLTQTVPASFQRIPLSEVEMMKNYSF